MKHNLSPERPRENRRERRKTNALNRKRRRVVAKYNKMTERIVTARINARDAEARASQVPKAIGGL